MTTTKRKSKPFHNKRLESALAAIETAQQAPQGMDEAWTVNTNVDFWTVVNSPNVPSTDDGYVRSWDHYNLMLGETGALMFTAKHGEHVDSVILSPAEVHVFYQFFAYIVMYRLAKLKGSA